MAKIAITGHSAGIGQALANIYREQGHEVVGMSRRNGYNIRNIPKLMEKIESCDIFINNAQVGFAQTELLFAVYEAWKGKIGKKIINIGTEMTLHPTSPLPGHDMLHYHVQKTTLDTAIKQLRGLHSWPKLCLVKPGAVATQINDSEKSHANVINWANQIVRILTDCAPLEVQDITLIPNYECTHNLNKKLKIAITGHLEGIGKSLSKCLNEKGHTIVGLDILEGFDIHNLDYCIDRIEPCDIFINNAYPHSYGQVEILNGVYERWKGIENKKIINIGSYLATFPASPYKDFKKFFATKYFMQKNALEHAAIQLRGYYDWPKLSLIRPGKVLTKLQKEYPVDNLPGADPDLWAKKFLELFNVDENLEVTEMTLLVDYDPKEYNFEN